MFATGYGPLADSPADMSVIAGLDSAGATKVTAVFINRCRAVLTERCRYITK